MTSSHYIALVLGIIWFLLALLAPKQKRARLNIICAAIFTVVIAISVFARL